MEEIEGFFRDGVPARRWKEQPRVGIEDVGLVHVDEAGVEKAKFERHD